jgi:hypothetical protein
MTGVSVQCAPYESPTRIDPMYKVKAAAQQMNFPYQGHLIRYPDLLMLTSSRRHKRPYVQGEGGCIKTECPYQGHFSGIHNADVIEGTSKREEGYL